MPETQRRPIGLHLAWLLSVAIAGAFVTALILATGDLASLWPLYIVPIVIASLGYQVSGAVLSVAVSAAIVALLAYGAGFESSPVPELLIGLIAYGVAGLAVGVQAQRSQTQRDLLELGVTRDALTGAWTSDHFDSRLAEEVRRSARYDQPCACVLIDIPDFVGFRREFGHVKGDLMLQRLADVVRLSIRETDAIGRHGTACFALVMPSTDKPHAEAVVGRVREAIAATEFEGDALEPTTRIVVETAMASYPEDAGEPGQLLAIAKARLPQRPAHAQRVGSTSETDSSGALRTDVG